MLVDLVDVAAGGIGLPDLDQRMRHRPAVLVADPARDDDPLAERRGIMLAGQVGIVVAHAFMAEHRSGELRQRGGQDDERFRGRAQPRCDIVGVEVGRIGREALGWIHDRHSRSLTLTLSFRPERSEAKRRRGAGTPRR